MHQNILPMEQSFQHVDAHLLQLQVPWKFVPLDQLTCKVPLEVAVEPEPFRMSCARLSAASRYAEGAMALPDLYTAGTR